MMGQPAPSASFVGQSLRKSEDPLLLQGRGRFVDDFRLPRMVHAAFVRSPVAHARILSVDTAAAESARGVVAVLTSKDFDAVCEGWSGLLSWPGMVAGEQHALATDLVRYVGEPVVVVVADSRAHAEDAAELVVLELEERVPVVDPVAALEPESPLVHEQVGTNLTYEGVFGGGEVDDAFADATHEVTVTMSTGRHTATAMEPRGVLAEGDVMQRSLTLRVSTQASHMLQATYARIFGLPESQVRVLADDVGGAFGMKAHVYPDEVAVCAASLVLRRPVKWVQDRAEALQADTHARDERVTARLALDADGRILGMRADVVSDGGAFSVYPRGMVTEGIQVATILPGPYVVPAYEGRVRVAMTNKSPLAVYRGVGHPVAILVMESLMDEAARRTQLLPDEIRCRNLVRSDQFPYRSITGNEYDSGSYRECLEQLVKRLDLPAWEKRKAEARSRGRLLGVGIAVFVELTAPGAQFYGARGAPITAHDQVEVRIEPDGTVTVLMGTAGQGQGLRTTAAQVVADHLGVEFDSVHVISGDTAKIPHGTGVWGSRSAVVAAGAVAKAAQNVRSRVLGIAEHMLEASVQDLVLDRGEVSVRGQPAPGLALREIAHAAHYGTHEIPPEVEVGLSAVGEYRGPNATFNNGAHAAVVEVDPDLGLIEVLTYEVVEDCGVLINPRIVDEQIRGGIVQGLGGALFEHLRYDSEGQLLTTTLLDYHLPTCDVVPDITISHIQTPSPLTSLGTKGAGEAGAAGAPAALHNAVNDALAQVEARVWHQPITPEQVTAAVARGETIDEAATV
jgi:carbon-monoxide dehydrogenase large subunit